jgi:RNA polymerase sigma-70 factor (ECF subfamily)
MQVAYPHLDFVFNMALRLSGNRYDAEDLTQETFATAFRKLHQLKDEGRCKFWLLSILRNLFLRGREKCRPELLDVQSDEDYVTVLENLAGEGNPEEILLDKSAAQEVQAILGGLPEKYQTPLILFYTEEWSYQEIAEGLELPMGTVMSRIGRGRELLKKGLLDRRQGRGQGKVIRPIFAGASRKG